MRCIAGAFVRGLLAAGCCVLVLSLSACDTATGIGETVVLEREVEFEFRFDHDPSAGTTAVVPSVERVDLEGNLGGFSKAEIVSATVISAELLRVQPAGVPLSDLMDAVGVRLKANGVPARTVANISGLPAASSVTLIPATNAVVTDLVVAPEFGAVVDLSGLQAESYVLEVTLQLRIELEG